MVDAFGVQHIERAPDVGRRAFFAGVRYEAQAEFAAAREHPSELLRRVATLAAVEADADELLAIRQRLLQCGERRLFAQVAQKTHDQQGADTELALRRLARTGEAVDHDLETHAAVSVSLRVEEDFGVHHLVGGGATEVGHPHVEEVFFLQQHARTSVIDVEKTL